MSDEGLAPIWRALANPIRREILDLLKERPRTTGELADAFREVSRFAVMEHLKVLREANLVLVRPRGRERWHHLNAVPLREIYDRWLSSYAEQWASSLIELKRFSEQAHGGAPMAQSSPALTDVQGFQIEQEVEIAASSDAVFRALTEGIDGWWVHRRFDAPSTVRLEAEIGGSFTETTDNGDAALWATVTEMHPNELLRLTGPMGMTGPVVGVIEYQLKPRGDGTLLRLSHRAFGDIDDETRDNYESGWQMLLNQALKQYVEGA